MTKSPKQQFLKLDERVFSVVEARNKRLTKSYEKLLPQLRAYYLDAREKWGDDGKITFADLNKYNRYGVTQKEMQAISTGFFKDISADIYGDLREIYAMSYEGGGEIIKTLTSGQIRGSMHIDVLEKAIKTPVGGLTIDLRFDRLRNDLADRMLGSVTRGIQNGDTWKTIAKDFSTQGGRNMTTMQRIIETEGHRLEEQAKLDVARKSTKPLLKEWVSMRDSHVRQSHKMLDGVAIPIEDNFTSPTGAVGLMPGSMGTAEDDINCRCFLVYKPVE